MIGVIDYKAGNAPSVLNALLKINVKAQLVSTNEQIEKCSSLILPGVGSSKATMESLLDLGCINTIEKMVFDKKIPFLGICIGLQILFDYSYEDNTPCLGWVKGKVYKFPENEVRVPQIGWNNTEFTRKHKILEGLGNEEYFYFVNSFYVLPEDENVILGKTQYGKEFCSMIAFDNIFGAQFHAEKSGEIGLMLLKNFAKLTGEVKC